jgi:hypothetical protein
MPIQAASILFNEKAYGADSPLGRRITPKSLTAITRQDLIDFHQKYFAPNNLYIGIAGNLSSAEAKDMLQNAFASWMKKDIQSPEVPAPVEKADGTVYYAYKDKPQANLYLGHLGMHRLNPDEFQIEIMNYIRNEPRAVCDCPNSDFCYNRYPAEVNLAWWLAWTSNPVGFTGRWARWVRFPCTSATFVFSGLRRSPCRILLFPLLQAVAVTVDFVPKLCPNHLVNNVPAWL